MANGSDSSDGLYGVCWKRFGAKRTSGFCFGTQSAEVVLFCKRKVFWCFRRVEEWIARVFGSRQCAKLVSNAYKSSL